VKQWFTSRTDSELHIISEMANVKHGEAMSDEIITAMSTGCGASIFLFELFKKKKPRKQLLF